MTVNANLLERREYKYLIEPYMCDEIRRQISPICTLDPHATNNGRYTIDSLYLDTDDLDLYYANDREQVDRVKVRARAYPAQDHQKVFLR